MKIAFSRTINELQGDYNNHGDCFFYGSIGGCDEGCPQLQRGECENWKENLNIIIGNDDLENIYKI